MVQKERIVEAAADMFAQQGIKSVRMDDIAAELSVSKRTLYAMFGDKEELIYCSLEHILRRQREKHVQIMNLAGNELEALFLIMRDMRKNAPVGRRMENNLKKFYPEVYERLTCEGTIRHRAGFKNVLERGVQNGIFRRELNLDLAVGMFMTVGYTVQSKGESIIPEEIPEEEAIWEIMTVLFRGIATPKGLEIIEHHAGQLQYD